MPRGQFYTVFTLGFATRDRVCWGSLRQSLLLCWPASPIGACCGARRPGYPEPGCRRSTSRSSSLAPQFSSPIGSSGSGKQLCAGPAIASSRS